MFTVNQFEKKNEDRQHVSTYNLYISGKAADKEAARGGNNRNVLRLPCPLPQGENHLVFCRKKYQRNRKQILKVAALSKTYIT